MVTHRPVIGLSRSWLMQRCRGTRAGGARGNVTRVPSPARVSGTDLVSADVPRRCCCSALAGTSGTFTSRRGVDTGEASRGAPAAPRRGGAATGRCRVVRRSGPPRARRRWAEVPGRRCWASREAERCGEGSARVEPRRAAERPPGSERGRSEEEVVGGPPGGERAHRALDGGLRLGARTGVRVASRRAASITSTGTSSSVAGRPRRSATQRSTGGRVASTEIERAAPARCHSVSSAGGHSGSTWEPSCSSGGRHGVDGALAGRVHVEAQLGVVVETPTRNDCDRGAGPTGSTSISNRTVRSRASRARKKSRHAAFDG